MNGVELGRGNLDVVVRPGSVVVLSGADPRLDLLVSSFALRERGGNVVIASVLAVPLAVVDRAGLAVVVLASTVLAVAPAPWAARVTERVATPGLLVGLLSFSVVGIL